MVPRKRLRVICDDLEICVATGGLSGVESRRYNHAHAVRRFPPTGTPKVSAGRHPGAVCRRVARGDRPAATAGGNSAGSFGRAKHCILVYLLGGPPQIDMWDLKPDAPAEIRGPFRPIASQVAGMQFCEHLPRLAGAPELAICGR